jgi:hypothetical protein
VDIFWVLVLSNVGRCQLLLYDFIDRILISFIVFLLGIFNTMVFLTVFYTSFFLLLYQKYKLSMIYENKNKVKKYILYSN